MPQPPLASAVILRPRTRRVQDASALPGRVADERARIHRRPTAAGGPMGRLRPVLRGGAHRALPAPPARRRHRSARGVRCSPASTRRSRFRHHRPSLRAGSTARRPVVGECGLRPGRRRGRRSGVAHRPGRPRRSPRKPILRCLRCLASKVEAGRRGRLRRDRTLARGVRSRVPLHQVHPLLVHAVLFGGGYLDQAVSAARDALRRG